MVISRLDIPPTITTKAMITKMLSHATSRTVSNCSIRLKFLTKIISGTATSARSLCVLVKRCKFINCHLC